jgi:UDP-2,3-diacylglucosamine pyrophosphatase LpxH
VRYVLLGHSHQAGSWQLSNGSTYVNVGTWVPAGGEAYFVYFSIEHDGAQQDARLWRWNRQKRMPEPFQP